jgi:hypothetical protein
MNRIQRLVIFTGLLAFTGAGAGAEMGRIFFTPAQRATLDNARKQNIRVEMGTDSEQPTTQAPVPHNISVNGLIRRSDGKNTIWLNNRVIDEHQPGTISAAIGKTDNRVLLNVPESGRKLDLKVGQSVEIVSGTIEESYLRRPASKPEPKAEAEGQKSGNDVAKDTPPAPRDVVKSALQRRPPRADSDSRDESRIDDGSNRK